jgi:eukaryotic-like serine/threonine-protein kinase
MAGDLRDDIQSALGATYTIERELTGGMSRVFVAQEERLHRKVVIKLLNPEVAAAVSVERFEREMQLAAQLQEPRIVPVLSSGEAAGLPYYTMPFVEGESLRERLSRGRLPLAESIAILRDVASALEYAHSRGVAHRDIKPENILISHNTAVVTDFGLAKAIATAADAPSFRTLTQQGFTLGTPAYMSPEQALGDTIDHRADIYSWGVVAYEVLAGEHPFGHKATGQAIVAAHIGETPAPLEAKTPGIPAQLAQLVERALSKDPSARPPNAGALLSALDLAASGVSGSASAKRPSILRKGVLVGALLAVAAFSVVLLQLPSRDAAGDPSTVRSIAVMPFAEMGGDTSAAYLGDGMTEALTTTLAKLPDLRLVAPRTASVSGKRIDVRDAGRALKVDAVLEGTVQRQQGQLRIRAHLIRVSDGEVIWGESYDRQAGNMFQLEDDVTATIASALRGTLSGGRASLTSGSPRGTQDLEAYDLYLRGRYAWSKRGERNLRNAIELFDQAIARDPSFARAHAGRAMSYVVLPIFVPSLDPDSAVAAAIQSANRALMLDSSLADAHLAVAYAQKMRWQWEEAERHFRAAVALAPDDAGIHHWYGVYLYAVGEAERAVAEFQRAVALEPYSAAVRTDRAWALYFASRLGEARQEIQRAFVMDATRSDIWYEMGLIQLAQGNPDSAMRSLDTARQLGTAFDVRPYFSVAYRAVARTNEADSVYAELRREYAAGHLVGYDLAVAAAAAGDRATALAAVKRMVEERDYLVTELSLPCDPLLGALRSDRQFQRLLSSAGFQPCR